MTFGPGTFWAFSHEFRTPLTLILGPLEQMLTGPREEEREQKKKMRMMLRNSRRLLGLINQLLELSKFDSGKREKDGARQDFRQDFYYYVILSWFSGAFSSPCP